MAGEYLDDIPGTEVLAPDGRQHLGTAGSRYRRIYQRGSPEYLHARQAGLLEQLPALVPAPADAVEEAEDLLGCRLPPLFRRLYLEVGNGGFGPGYGMLGLRGGHRDDTRQAALGLYRQAHGASSPHWSFLPAGLLPICYWGCGIYSFIDCSRPEGPMWGWDPNPGPVDRQALFPQPLALAGWLDRWVGCTLFQPALVRDPDTQQWRGATEQEYARWAAEMEEPAS
jgi:SMI1 / KNR4 family (SUKH-1)